MSTLKFLGSLSLSYLLPVFFLAGCAVRTTGNERLIPDCSGANCGSKGCQRKNWRRRRMRKHGKKC